MKNRTCTLWRERFWRGGKRGVYDKLESFEEVFGDHLEILRTPHYFLNCFYCSIFSLANILFHFSKFYFLSSLNVLLDIVAQLKLESNASVIPGDRQ